MSYQNEHRHETEDFGGHFSLKMIDALKHLNELYESCEDVPSDLWKSEISGEFSLSNQEWNLILNNSNIPSNGQLSF